MTLSFSKHRIFIRCGIGCFRMLTGKPDACKSGQSPAVLNYYTNTKKGGCKKLLYGNAMYVNPPSGKTTEFLLGETGIIIARAPAGLIRSFT